MAFLCLHCSRRLTGSKITCGHCSLCGDLLVLLLCSDYPSKWSGAFANSVVSRSAHAWRMLHIECLSWWTSARQSCCLWSCCITSSACLQHSQMGSGSYCLFWRVLLKVYSLSLPHVVISIIDAWFPRKQTNVQLVCLPVTIWCGF